MAKILKIDGETVFIGMDDHTTIEVEKSKIKFDVTEMMVIDVYKYNSEYLFSIPTVKNINVDEKSIDGIIYVKKVPYVLWYFFLGGFGIHEFYAGNKTKGFAWLGVTILLYIIQAVISYGDGSQASYRYGNVHMSEGHIFITTVSVIYFILIRVLAIVATTKQSNENEKILISKW